LNYCLGNQIAGTIEARPRRAWLKSGTDICNSGQRIELKLNQSSRVLCHRAALSHNQRNRFANVAGLIRRKNRRVDVKADRAGRHRKRNPVAREQRAKVCILEHRSDARKILCCQNLNPANNSVGYRTPDKGDVQHSW
jgi:hypothetical protein